MANILIVEDDRIVARDIRQQLEAMGHTVAGMTADGAQAPALARSAGADLVLMDIRLAGAVDGIQAARAIREQCDIPVIFLTAYADDETIRRANLTEPFGYLLKPFETSQLRTVVEMAVYKHAAERRLRQSERRYAATLASIGDAVIVVDPGALVSYINPVALRLTGWPAGKAEGQPLDAVFRVVDETMRSPLRCTALDVLRDPAQGGQLVRTALLLSRTGEEWPVEEQSTPLAGERETSAGAVLVFRELSGRRAMERALRHAHRELGKASLLTSMGEVTASIAHEINQPLAAIVTNASAGLNWLRKAPPELDETRQCLERIKADGSRAADVIASLRNLVKSAGTSVAELDLQSLLRQAVELMRPEIDRHGVRLQVQSRDTLPQVLADRVQIQQVLINLIANAIDAMAAQPPGARSLTISLRIDPAAGKVHLAVADTGTGLPPGAAADIFKPFFTTKADGMGMGLAICRTIVEAHGGSLAATPMLPHGTVLTFDLPLAAGMPPAAPPG
ncbi:ATP-binding protein [Pseudorhodoferax soli]|uniref:histidine kinase n=1 Tax=Pseudorhodoferax soli TaxID=545864 RepID=A0A368XT20_9BURK|nr:ATP-binding protein [Pseudorhodoferax soli]RCW70306.1 PAS/PAC sensor hybrid histidine kinase [Pseudorhodoferax soli]